MANYPVDLAPFIPHAFDIEDGGAQRIPRVTVNLSGSPVHAHEEFIIGVDVYVVLQPQDHQGFMHQVRDFIANDLVLPVTSVCMHPLGIGLF
jgi:hypothetical protein